MDGLYTNGSGIGVSEDLMELEDLKFPGLNLSQILGKLQHSKIPETPTNTPKFPIKTESLQTVNRPVVMLL